jgi:hypothetical protein
MAWFFNDRSMTLAKAQAREQDVKVAATYFTSLRDSILMLASLMPNLGLAFYAPAVENLSL